MGILLIIIFYTTGLIFTSDISIITKSLELSYIKLGYYPEPDDPKSITYSGGIVWYQGLVGESVIRKLGNLSNKPIDPKFSSEYTYSITTLKQSYQLGGILENQSTFNFFDNINNISIDKVYASDNYGEFSAYVKGNYDGLFVVSKTGSTNLICNSIATPSIILSEIPEDGKLESANSGSLVYNGKNNIPSSYKTSVGKTYFTGAFLFRDFKNSDEVVVYTGCNIPNSLTGALELAQGLRNVYKDTVLENDSRYTDLVSTIDAPGLVNIGINIANNYLANKGLNGDKLVFDNKTMSMPVFNCKNPQPTISYSTGFTIGNPTSFDQEWGYSNIPSSCTFACETGYVWDTNTNNCIPDVCSGDLASLNGIQIIGSTQSITQSWKHESIDTDNICKYECSSGYSYSTTNSKCEPNNCLGGNYIVSGHSYNVPDLNHNSYTTINYSTGIINGTRNYSQDFSCSLGVISLSGSEVNTSNSCNSGYTWDGDSSCTDQTAPTITSVTAGSPSCEVVRFTINGASDIIGLHSSPYSFDGGSTWQTTNYKDYSFISYTLATSKIKVKDAAGNIYTYTSSKSGTSSSCAVNCSYTTYQGSTCSVSCGGGNYATYYNITVPASGGGTCSVSQGQFAGRNGSSCNTQSCCDTNMGNSCVKSSTLIGCNVSGYLYSNSTCTISATPVNGIVVYNSACLTYAYGSCTTDGAGGYMKLSLNYPVYNKTYGTIQCNGTCQ